jgi:fumarate hydratase class II
MNEVVAALASTSLPERVHPNDHVNLGQSSNDVIPTAIHLNCVLQCNKSLIPNLRYLAEALEQKALTLKGVVKTGRTHLMDAMPLPMTEEVRAWAHQIHQCVERIESVMSRLYQIAQGGTAVGTGVNTHPEFAQRFAKLLAEDTGMPFVTSPSTYASLSCCDTVVELSGQLKVLAVSLLKICNDLRWMNSGPVCGLGEITLEALQPGSSIMPGKVNPVIPEAVAMVAAQVIGNDATITLAGQSGLFQLNVMLPIVAYNIDQSLNLLGNAVRVLADRAIRTFRVNDEHLRQKLMMNPILATVLTTKIGYEKTAELVKQAYREHRSIREMAKEKTELSDVELDELLSLDHLLGPSTLRRGIMPP